MSVSESKSKAVYIRATTLHSPVYVKGTVKADSTESASKAGTYIFDLTGTDGDLVIYYARSTAKLVAGDEVVVYGHLKLFTKDNESKYEMDVANNIALGVVSINGTATTFVPGTKDTEEIPDDQKGGKNNPYTVEELRALTATTVPEGLVYAQGYVKTIAAHKDSGYNINLVDTKDGTDTFYIFRGDLASSAIPCVGDKVQAYGYLVAYNSNYQFSFKNNTSTEVSILERADATIKSAESNQHVTITFTPAADAMGIVRGKNGANVSFTVECDEGWELNGEPADAVSVSGGEVVYNSGMYLVKLVGNMEVKVSVKEEGAPVIEKGTEGNPYTVAEAIAISKALPGQESKKTVYNTKATFVKGYVVKISSQSEFEIADSVTGTNTFTFYQGEKDSGITVDVYLGDEVLLYGYIAHYGVNYKCEVTGKTDSSDAPKALIKDIKTADGSIAQETTSDYTITFTPATGKNGIEVSFTIAVNAQNKVVKAVTVTNGEATLTDEATNTYKTTLNGNMIVTVELKDAGDTVQTLTIDFTKSIDADPAFISSSANATITPTTTTFGGITYQYQSCYKNSSYLMMYAKLKGNTGKSYFANTTAIPGNITKITVITTTGSGASSTNAEWHIVLGASALTSLQTSGEAIKGQGELTPVTATVADGYSYFNISVTSTSYNGQIAQIVIDYEPAA